MGGRIWIFPRFVRAGCPLKKLAEVLRIDVELLL